MELDLNSSGVGNRYMGPKLIEFILDNKYNIKKISENPYAFVSAVAGKRGSVHDNLTAFVTECYEGGKPKRFQEKYISEHCLYVKEIRDKLQGNEQPKLSEGPEDLEKGTVRTAKNDTSVPELPEEPEDLEKKTLCIAKNDGSVRELPEEPEDLEKKTLCIAKNDASVQELPEEPEDLEKKTLCIAKNDGSVRELPEEPEDLEKKTLCIAKNDASVPELPEEPEDLEKKTLCIAKNDGSVRELPEEPEDLEKKTLCIAKKDGRVPTEEEKHIHCDYEISCYVPRGLKVDLKQIWVFVPSYGRSSFARLDYSAADIGKDTIVAVVVRPDELQEYRRNIGCCNPPFRIFPCSIFAFLLRLPNDHLPTPCPDTHVSMKTISKLFAVKKVGGWGGGGGCNSPPPRPEKEGVAAKIF